MGSWQKLLTKAAEKSLPPLYSTEKVAEAEKVVQVKFFVPWGRGTWYVVEGSRQENGDLLMFGYCESPLGSDCNEWGYVSLNELAAIKGPAGLKIERDMYWTPVKMGEVLAGRAK